MFLFHLDYFKEPPLGGRPNTRLEDHDTPETHNGWLINRLIIFNHVRVSHMNSLKQHLVEGLFTCDFTLPLKTCDHTSWFWKCLGTGLWTTLLGSRNFMVSPLGLCVKRPSWKTCVISSREKKNYSCSHVMNFTFQLHIEKQTDNLCDLHYRERTRWDDSRSASRTKCVV